MNKKINYPLLILLFIAFIIRVIGIIPGHPPDHPDEPMSYSSAMEMLIHNDLNPRRFDYPAGVPLLHYMFYKSFVLPPSLLGAFITHPDIFAVSLHPLVNIYKEYPDIILGRSGIPLLFWSRFLTAFLGAASVFLLYKIGEKLFHPYVGIASAFFLAVNYRHILSSHLALSDIPNSFFALLAFYASILLLERNTPRRYIFCGFFIGLSIAMKYQVFAIFPFLFVHLIWVIRKKTIQALFDKYFLFALALIPTIFILLNPYLLLNLKTALPVIHYLSLRYGAGVYRFNFYPLYYLYHWGIGMLPFIAIIAGFVLAVIRNPVKTLFVLAYVAPFLYVFLYYMTGGTYIRNFTTVMPYLMLFAGCFVAYIILFAFKKLKLRKVYTLILLFIVLFIVNWNSLVDSLTLSISYTKTWNRDRLTEWVQRNIPAQSKILNSNIGLGYTEKSFELIPWEHKEVNSIAELQKTNADFAVSNTSWYQIYLFWFDTPFWELIKADGIPYKRLLDSFYGLSFLEFKDYAVFETYKPWQAPENNYVVLKVPQKVKNLGTKVTSFSFDTSASDWRVWDGLNARFQSVKHLSGSLLFDFETDSNYSLRAVSSFIPIKGKRAYAVTARVKPNKDIARIKKDGFFRIDFYKEKSDSSLKNLSLRTALSERVFGDPNWKELSVITQAPKGAKYVVVSFQRSFPQEGNSYLIDDVILYEDPVREEERMKEITYRRLAIPFDVVFPNSIY